jgi:hypothetical protein
VSFNYILPVLDIHLYLHPHSSSWWPSTISERDVRLRKFIGRERDSAGEGVDSSEEEFEMSVRGCGRVLWDHWKGVSRGCLDEKGYG